MKLNPFKIITYQLYLLQLENYNIPRYWRLWKKLLIGQTSVPRQRIVWTPKAKLLLVIAAILQSSTAMTTAAALNYQLFYSAIALTVFFILFFLALVPFYFLFFMAAVVIIYPLDHFIKKIIINSARRKIVSFKNLIIIGITGSYGKTTTKELLATVLQEKFHVLKTPENINTPVGISRFIIKNLEPETQIFIAEMSAYQKGDIKTLCDIAKPQIAVLAGINESHLERFGGMENTVSAKFEIIDNMKDDGAAVLNADSSLIVAEYQKHPIIPQTSLNLKSKKDNELNELSPLKKWGNGVNRKNQKIFFYSSDNNSLSQYKIENKRFFEDGSGISFELRDRRSDLQTGGRTSQNFKLPHLGEYIIGTTITAVIVARELGLNYDEIRRGLAMAKPIPHRLQPIFASNNILIIDDSYNGNPEGVKEAIKTLRHFKNRRKIYLTPGLVETGEKTEEIHYNIGKELARTADLVILIKNSVTPFIAAGLKENDFLSENIVWFDTASEAHNSVKTILKPNDVILFQNDWPDNYS